MTEDTRPERPDRPTPEQLAQDLVESIPTPVLKEVYHELKPVIQDFFVGAPDEAQKLIFARSVLALLTVDIFWPGRNHEVQMQLMIQREMADQGHLGDYTASGLALIEQVKELADKHFVVVRDGWIKRSHQRLHDPVRMSVLPEHYRQQINDGLKLASQATNREQLRLMVEELERQDAQLGQLLFGPAAGMS